MPVVLFEVRWPDQSISTCYSPSSIVKESFEEGASYDVADFLARADRSLKAASQRVAEKYGSPCGQALGQLAVIHERVKSFESIEDARIEVIRFL
jgi:uncharacterized repeat protein (TIGR04042 family)